MTVAATKTKAEQALTQSFEAVASRLPGGRAVAEARKAAIGTFSALGLPHRRIEQWKYTDLRVALKEALPPAVGEQAKVTAAEIDRALESLAALDAVRVVFVDGVHRPELSSPAAATGLEITSLAAALAKSADSGGEVLSRAVAPGPGGGDRPQHGLHDRRRRDPHRRRRAAGKAAAARLRGREQAGPPRHHAQYRQARRRRARHHHRGACDAPRCSAGPGQCADRSCGRRQALSSPT